MRLVADGGSWQPVFLRDAPICERCLASSHIHWLSAPRGYNSWQTGVVKLLGKCSTWALKSNWTDRRYMHAQTGPRGEGWGVLRRAGVHTCASVFCRAHSPNLPTFIQRVLLLLAGSGRVGSSKVGSAKRATAKRRWQRVLLRLRRLDIF